MDYLIQPEPNPTVGRNLLAVYRYKRNFIKLLNKIKFKIMIIIACLIIINFVYQRQNIKYKFYTELMDKNGWLKFYDINRNRRYLNDFPKGYLVFSGGCQIPDYIRFSQVMKNFKKQIYTECMPNEKPITRLVHNYKNQSVHVIIDNSAKTNLYGKEPIFCCYYEVTRSGINKTADMQFNTSSCILFSDSIQLPMHIEYIVVKCNSTKIFDPIYVNIHFVVIKKADVEVRIQRFAKRKSKKPLSVLLIGIKSISRFNLIQAMPQTTQYLYNNDWFELVGYNKIADDTFKNLMAILTGYNSSKAFDKCNPNVFGKLDTCPLIWKDFHDNGYVTAYAEDEAKITTFKYGFSKQPTDYYMRPILLAGEVVLPITNKNGLPYCLGYTQYADYIFDYGIDFSRTFHNQPHFGLFWVNTFSHEALSDPSAMDLKIRNYLFELNVTGILDESMVIFFSDHDRFGPIRQIDINWLEERLPFMFISLPKWFRMENPEYVQSLQVNQNRLTNPYDIHMTLKHIIKMSDPEYAAENINYSADACKKCQSIFHDVPINRFCSDANIESHWCACIKFESIDLLSSFIQNATKYIIEYMNTVLLVNYLADSNVNNTGILDKGKSCAKLKLREIKSAGKGETTHFHVLENYLIIYETAPGDGVFETTLTYESSTNNLQITGAISRLNKYGNQSSCVKDVQVKKYCYCIDELMH